MIERNLPTIEQIKEKYPPKRQEFKGVEAEVSMNDEGKIVYIVPFSAVKIKNSEVPELSFEDKKKEE